MNRGKDRRRYIHTHLHLPGIPCLVDMRVRTRVRIRFGYSSVTHIAEKKEVNALDYTSLRVEDKRVIYY